MNNCFQIYEIKNHSNHAGSKAPDDVAKIAVEEGFKKICIVICTGRNNILTKLKRQFVFLFNWLHCYIKIRKNGIALIQFPFAFRQLIGVRILQKLKFRKNVRFIMLIHDVDELRTLDLEKQKSNRQRMNKMINLADMIIVHNSVMFEWFSKRGIPSDKLIDLQIFDYLWDISTDEKTRPVFNKSVSIAGNLSKEKSGYIYQLDKVANIMINLYGPNYEPDEKKYSNVCYFGSFRPEEVPSKLTEGFGLVWDGDSIDGCQGEFGEYLRYNNPHKLSLFLAAGLPVVIWKQAAEANFVEEHGLGICVDTLDELTTIFEKLDRDQYYQMAENVRIIGERLRTGQYTREALRIAHDRLEGK